MDNLGDGKTYKASKFLVTDRETGVPVEIVASHTDKDCTVGNVNPKEEIRKRTTKRRLWKDDGAGS
jgi:hypothetical protein